MQHGQQTRALIQSRLTKFKSITSVRHLLLIILATFALLLVVYTAVAQNDPVIDLSTPDTTEFPNVQLRIISIDDQGAPLPESRINELTLRENGVPIPDFDLRFVPVGIDATFVIDADTTIGFEDGIGGTRLDQVKASVIRYANRFMSPAGLDRVSIIVPDRNNEQGTFLLQDASDPQTVIEAISNYNPILPESAPVNEMVTLALAHGEEIGENGRFQSILLFSDAFKLSEQLDYTALTETARAQQTPIYVAVLGGLPTQEAIGNASALAAPTRGYYVTMPFAEESDPVYLVWQRQGNQPQLNYTSLLKESGVYPVSINLGTQTASTKLALTLETPLVTIALDSPVLRRIGDTPDTALADLQPTVQEIPIQVTWPDGLTRALTGVTFRINGQAYPLPTLPQPDENGIFTIEWNVQNVGTGVYDLDVQILDELGFAAASDVLIVTMAEERPLPPTATPEPSPTPQPVDTITEIAQRPRTDLLIILIGVGLLGILLLLVRFILRERRKTAVAEYRAQRREILQERAAQQPAIPVEEDAVEPMAATLIRLDQQDENEPIPVAVDSLTFGTDETAVDVVLVDRSVSPLHARVRQHNGRFWLYDEGSENGTFINHTRLGLRPKSLENDDIIRIGRVRFQVKLTPLNQDETDETISEQSEAQEEEPPENTE